MRILSSARGFRNVVIQYGPVSPAFLYRGCTERDSGVSRPHDHRYKRAQRNALLRVI